MSKNGPSDRLVQVSSLTPQQRLQELQERLPSGLLELLESDPCKGFIIARAANIAAERGSAHIEVSDIESAWWELDHAVSKGKSWSGFFYATGGAVLSVGLGAIITCLYFLTVPYTGGQLLPFVFLTLLGLLLIFAGRHEE